MQQTEQRPHQTQIDFHKASVALDDATAAVNVARVCSETNPIAYRQAVEAQAQAIKNYKDALKAVDAYHATIFKSSLKSNFPR